MNKDKKPFDYSKLKNKFGLPYYFDRHDYKHIDRQEPRTELRKYLYNYYFEGSIGQNVENIGAATNNINALLGELLIRNDIKNQDTKNKEQSFNQILTQIETQLNTLLDSKIVNDSQDTQSSQGSNLRIQELEGKINLLERKINLLEEVQQNNNKLLRIVIEKLG